MMETHDTLGAHYLLLQSDLVIMNPVCFMVWSGCLLRSVSVWLTFMPHNSIVSFGIGKMWILRECLSHMSCISVSPEN